MMRVGIPALLHESNTFVTRPTTIDDFRREWLIEGDAVRKQLADGHQAYRIAFELLPPEAQKKR